MTKLVTAKLILSVGSLQFMEAEGLYLIGKSAFYWKFANSSTYYGPFNTLMECGMDVDMLMQGGMPTLAAPPQITGAVTDTLTPAEVVDNVINVDFKNKRRV